MPIFVLRLIVLSVGLFALATAELSAQQADSAQIAWHEDAHEAVRVARAQRRPLLVYVTSAHCGHCRTMERQTWKDESVIRSVSGRYVALKLSSERHPAAIEQLKVQAFPTTIVLTADIKVHEGAVGMLTPEEAIRLLTRGPAVVAHNNVNRQ